MTDRRRSWSPGNEIPLALGFLVGLVFRCAMLFHMGVFDMDAYVGWGRDALRADLPSTYHGIYFPLQYQIFEVCAWISGRLGTHFVPVFKAANLLFDIGCFALVVSLLTRQGSRPIHALVYWLHPFLLAIFSLGYIDYQFAFFVLLSASLANGPAARRYLAAGVPLGLAFLMKPQAQILVIVTFLFGVFRAVRTRDARPFAMLVGPAVLFLGYEFYFTLSLFPRLGYGAASVLPSSYLGVTNVMPCLSAQLPNIWYPVAFFMKRGTDPIWAISDQTQMLPYISAKYVAGAAALALVGWHVFRTEREARSPVTDRFVTMFGFASLTVPFLMTSAHENHLFLGCVFLVLFMASHRSLPFRAASHALLLIQFLNVFGLYGEHPGLVAGPLKSTYSETLAVVYSFASVACFCLIARVLLRAGGGSEEAPPVAATSARPA
jgi:hypothetical protein